MPRGEPITKYNTTPFHSRMHIMSTVAFFAQHRALRTGGLRYDKQQYDRAVCGKDGLALSLLPWALYHRTGGFYEVAVLVISERSVGIRLWSKGGGEAWRSKLATATSATAPPSA